MPAVSIAIHQPNYLPWIGYFQKMALADIFVFLDIAQFSKDSYTQRTKIRTPKGWCWLTIPIDHKYYFQPIMTVKLPSDTKWLITHKKSIVANYAKSPAFDEVFIEEYYDNYSGGSGGGNSKFKSLVEFNEYGIVYLKTKFNIRTKLIRASELNIAPELKATDLLIAIVKELGGDIYISGVGGKNYQDELKFDAEGIKLKYFEYQPVEYKQRWYGFESGMSAIDLLFNLGAQKAEKLIKAGKCH